MNLPDDGFKAAYETKNAQYFSGARSDFIAQLPDHAKARILEIGCGHGETGELALAQGKCGEYVGIEISKNAAAVAGEKISSVLVGNVETIEFPWVNGSFDAVIMSEVLEHLVDPWQVVKRISPLLRGGALVMASSPNVSQYKMIVSLALGRWRLSNSGLMDRTHLRWFTPGSYKELFEQSGIVVDYIGPVVPFSTKTRIVDNLTFNRFHHLFIRQIKMIGRKIA